MNAAYIGILTPGSTSRMRAECLRALTPAWTWTWVDTDPPMIGASRAWRSLAFRFKTGKAVDAINRVVQGETKGSKFGLAWVDKGVFLRPETVGDLRRAARRLVHFTPDTAFHENRSRHFLKTVGLYDLLVTTKLFEVDDHRRLTGADTLFVTTQGYDPAVHYPRGPASERRREAVFVGLAEPDRERCITTLLEHGIQVRLAGLGWRRFVHRWRDSPLLAFEGEEVFGDEYASLLSQSWVGLGLLSKRFPELHTTRTFEIPACGAVLATEATAETTRFFSETEAVFFGDHGRLAHRLKAMLRDESAASLSVKADAGRRRVLADGRDYASILSAILADRRVAI